MAGIGLSRKFLFSTMVVLLLCAQLLTGLPVASAAPAVIATITVGGYPIDAGVNPATNRIYVANTTGDSVTVVDGSTNAVTATITVGDAPYAVDVNTSTNVIYTANYSGNNVSVISGATNAVTATVAVGSSPYALDVNPATNMIYVVNQASDNVSVISGATNAVIATIGVGDRPGGVAVNSTTNRIYVANANSNNVSVIDGATNAVTATVAVGDGCEGIDLNPATNRIYVANQWDYTVSVIDGSTNTVTATVTLGNMNNQGVGVNSTTNRIYVSSFYNGRVNVIDGSTNTATANLGVGSGPWGVGVNPTTSRVYVGNSNGGNVSVIYDPFIITASAGAGGSISPSGAVGVNPGASQAFTIAPSTGYYVSDVFVDGVYQGTPTSYTFTNVASDHSISAQFAINTYAVSTSVSGGHGSIQGAQSVNYNESASVAITPDAGYHIATITDNGAGQTVANPYVISNVTTAHNVVVTFAADSYSVNASVFLSSGGDVNPATQDVGYNGAATIDLIPDTGYHPSYILDNGASATVADPYVINNVTGDHTVIVFFEPDTCTISASVDGSGTVSGAGDYQYGETATLTATPGAGRHFTNWTDAGGEVSTDATYSFTVTGPKSLTAHFVINTCDIDASVYFTGHGGVSPATQTVDWGTTATIDLIPDAGYHVAYITDNGLPQAVADPYAIPAVSADHTVIVTFAPDTFMVDAEVTGGHGTVDPASQATGWGTEAEIEITPEQGYHIASITDNGVPATIAAPYVIPAVSADHTVIVTFAPDTDTDTWYLAEGCTAEGAETWILVENPNPAPVTLDISFATAEGLFAPSALQGVVLAAGTRASFSAGDFFVSYELSTIVSATGGRVVCERSMYGADRVWATESIGTRTPAGTWYLAEGSTGEGFETWVLVQNPGDADVTVDLTLMTSTGELSPVSAQDVPIPAKSRRSFNLGEYLTDYNVSTVVTSTGGDVVCERAMYGADRVWGTCSIGTQAPTGTWYLAEGSTGEGFETWVLVQNPGATTVTVDLTLMTSTGEQAPAELQDVAIPAGTRRSFNLGDYVTDFDISTVVNSTGGDVVAERAMYNTDRVWATCSIGTQAPAGTWYLAEGSTGEGFETWVLVQNPGATAVTVDLTFITSSGQQAGPRDVAIPAGTRRSFNLGDYLTDYNVSTVVTSTGGVVVERAMYGAGRTWATDSIGFAP